MESYILSYMCYHYYINYKLCIQILSMKIVKIKHVPYTMYFLKTAVLNQKQYLDLLQDGIIAISAFGAICVAFITMKMRSHGIILEKVHETNEKNKKILDKIFFITDVRYK